MRKTLVSVFLLTCLFFSTNSAKAAMNYEDAINQSKPVAILVYANWATDADKAVKAFKALEQTYSDKFNFVLMNIADETTKPFNEVYHIYPKMPYMLLFRDKGKFSRYLQKDCLLNNSCVDEKIKFFIN